MPLHESLTTCDTEDFAKTSQFLFSSYSQRYVRLRVQVASFEAQMKVELLEHQFYMKYEKLKDDQTKKVMHQNNCNNILRRENDIQLSYKRSRLGAYVTRLSASGSVDSSFQTDGNCILGEEDTSLVDDLQSNEILVQQVSVCRKVVASKIPNLCNLIIEILRLYITDLEEGLGADLAGLKANDIIKSVDGITINEFADLSGYLASKRPGEKVTVTFKRDGKEKKVAVRLEKINRALFYYMEVRELSPEQKKSFNTEHGLYISNMNNRRLYQRGIDNGYVILEVNGKKVAALEDIKYMEVPDIEDILFLSPDGEKKIVMLQY